MSRDDLLNKILLDWAVKSSDGLSSTTLNENSLESLHETLLENGVNGDVAVEIVNEVGLIAEKGKHPERQAYNKNGILVTFPTPEYKARAIAKGTHFEKNPKVGQSNLFGGGQQAPTQPAPQGGAPSSPMDTQQSELPPSDTQQAQTPPAQKEIPEPGTPGTPAVGGSSGGSAGPSSSTPPAQGQLTAAPVPVATPAPQNVAQTPPPEPVPTVKKTPQEIEAEKQTIKQILNTNDVLPTVAGVGSNAISEELKKLTKIAIEMNLTEAVKFLSKHL